MSTTSSSKTKITSLAAAVALVGLGAIQTQGQSVVYNFPDTTGDGWTAGGFSAGAAPTITAIGGVNYMYVPLGGFQVANVASGYALNNPNFTATMAAAAANPAGYDISYNYYVNTATFVGTTFFQFGTFVNTGSGYYAQDYGSPNELQLNGTQTASGQIFTGTVTVNMAAVGFNMPAADTFFRLGLVENGNGTGVGAYITDISVTPTPEPATLSLFGLGLAAGAAFLRRRKA